MTNNVIFTEDSVREDILRRAMVNQVAKNAALKPAPVTKATPVEIANPHAATIEKLNAILDKVSGFENSKITAMCELLIALETGNDQNLIKFLKTKDKTVKIKAKY